MKYNLRNRPRYGLKPKSKTRLWFEGFEKELKERQQKCSRMSYNPSYRAISDFIKEILGEDV